VQPSYDTGGQRSNHEDKPVKFSEQIRHLRQKKGWTLRELAAQVGVVSGGEEEVITILGGKPLPCGVKPTHIKANSHTSITKE
jgi:transcriptional regulator with XRE-family HTH domain